MKYFFITMAIGLGAGIIDIIPMILKKLDTMFILSALSMWIVVGILFAKVRFTTHGWLDGIILALLVFLPLFFLIFRLDKIALPQICLSTLILGAAVGFLSNLVIK